MRVKAGQSTRRDEPPAKGICGAENRILAGLGKADRAVIDAHIESVDLKRGDIVIHAGEQVQWAYFPNIGTVLSLCTVLEDGRTVEAATVGCEGVIGGVVSCGTRPAFANALVQIAGNSSRVPVRIIENLKDTSPGFRRLFDRYADFLFAQSLQSVACTAFHSLEQRLCRWLLTTQDRVGTEHLPLTQEALAEMIGVQRTTVSTVSRQLRERGLVSFRHGQIEIMDRSGLERAACTCYEDVERFRKAVTSNIVGAHSDA
jgi:CRP-like cAMP-binding protein